VQHGFLFSENKTDPPPLQCRCSEERNPTARTSAPQAKAVSRQSVDVEWDLRVDTFQLNVMPPLPQWQARPTRQVLPVIVSGKRCRDSPRNRIARHRRYLVQLHFGAHLLSQASRLKRSDICQQQHGAIYKAERGNGKKTRRKLCHNSRNSTNSAESLHASLSCSYEHLHLYKETWSPLVPKP